MSYVQAPVVNRIGDYVTEYNSSEFGITCLATILTWIEGTTLSIKEDDIEETAFALGEELAALHEYTRRR